MTKRRRRRSAAIGLIAAAITAVALAGSMPTAGAIPEQTTPGDTTTPVTAAQPEPAADTVDARGPGQAPGVVYASRELPRARMVSGAADGNAFTYWSVGADGKPHLSTGVLMIPGGKSPSGGWPIVAWAHGSRGIADSCAPSARPVKADTDEMRRWLGRGYAVVSTDYAGVGTPGTPQYYDLDATARNIVDALKAARDISDRLARTWVVVGEAQGASAAIHLARTAPTLQGSKLDFRGAAATSIPAEFSSLLGSLGPGSGVMPTGLAADTLYTLSAIGNAHRDVDLNTYLTDTGKQWLGKASTLCANDLVRQASGLVMGSLFTKPLARNTALNALLTKALALPTKGFVRPVLMTQSLQDTSVVVPTTLKYLNDARADRRVTARTYLTLDATRSKQLSENDTRAFVARLLR